MPVSSFIIGFRKKNEKEILNFLDSKEQYELLGIDKDKMAILSDTKTLEEEYALSKQLVDVKGVREINILFHHTQDLFDPKFQ
ncbi:hypothetical protein MJH12_05945 [bacterium]|nr:hypothetical protein [bacterium]